MLVRLSAVLLALLAGVMLLDAAALVPFWQSLPPPGVNEWFGRHAWRIDWLTAVIVVLACLAAMGGVAEVWQERDRRVRMTLACVAVLGIAAIGGFFHWPMSRLLATPDGVPAGRVAPVLWQWSAWEWLRVLLAVAGCAAAISATRPPPTSRSKPPRARGKQSPRRRRQRRAAPIQLPDR